MHSKARLQARATPQLHALRDLWHRLFNHGSSTIYRKHAGILNPSWTSRARLGMVPCIDVHLHRWARYGRSRKLNANHWWVILVDALLRKPENPQRAVIPGGLLEHARSSRWIMLHRLWLQLDVLVCDRYCKGRDLDSKLWDRVCCVLGLRPMPRRHCFQLLQGDGQASDRVRGRKLHLDLCNDHRFADWSQTRTQQRAFHLCRDCESHHLAHWLGIHAFG